MLALSSLKVRFSYLILFVMLFLFFLCFPFICFKLHSSVSMFLPRLLLAFCYSVPVECASKPAVCSFRLPLCIFPPVFSSWSLLDCPMTHYRSFLALSFSLHTFLSNARAMQLIISAMLAGSDRACMGQTRENMDVTIGMIWSIRLSALTLHRYIQLLHRWEV